MLKDGSNHLAASLKLYCAQRVGFPRQAAALVRLLTYNCFGLYIVSAVIIGNVALSSSKTHVNAA